MTDEIRPLIEVPIAYGPGIRKLAVTDDGTALVFTDRGTSAELAPDLTFDHAFAVRLARRALAGDLRAMTAPETLRVLAAAVLLLDYQLTPRVGEEEKL